MSSTFFLYYAWSSLSSSLDSVLAILEEPSLSPSPVLFPNEVAFAPVFSNVLSLKVPSNLATTSDFVFAYSIFYTTKE
jgi:hypothetical protein